MDMTTALTILGIAGASAGALLSIIKIYSICKKHLIKRGEQLRDWFNNPMKQELEQLKKEFKDKDYRDCQTVLLTFLNDIDNGEHKTEVQIEHSKHLYTHYCKNLNGNTYIIEEWDRIMNKKERRK